MGLKKTGNSGTWLSLTEGKFRLKTGDTTFEDYAILEGRIVDLRFKDNEWQGTKYRVLVVTMTDGKERYSFSVSLSSGYARQLLYKLANADLTKPVELCPTYSVDANGRKNAGMFVNQCGAPVKQKWTKDNPGELPQMKVVEIKGKKIFDDEAQLAFIEKYVAEVMLPLIKLVEKEAKEHQQHFEEIHSDEGGEPVAADVDEEAVPF